MSSVLRIVEFTNGVLLWLFLYMLSFIFYYLWRRFRELHLDLNSWQQSLRIFYHSQRPALATGLIISGLFWRTVLTWAIRHYWDGHTLGSEIRGPVTALYFVSTAAIIAGVVCWIRVMSPFRYTNEVWMSMVLFAFTWAWYMTYGY
jgi:hypothetical protein